jgi:hypothetical protein
MMRGYAQLLDARTVRWLDLGVLVWVVVWAALGVLVWQDITAQTSLPGDVIKVGSAVRDTGQALGVVGGLPLVGDRIGDFAAEIEKLGDEVVASGETSQDGILRVAVIAGIAVGVLPAAMALFLYLPVRVRWRRSVKSVADALGASSGDPAFEHYLARRALDALPWDELRGIAPDPWRAVADGDFRALADAELRRLGLKRS